MRINCLKPSLETHVLVRIKIYHRAWLHKHRQKVLPSFTQKMSSTLSRRKCYKKTLTIPTFSYNQFSPCPEPQKMGFCETASRVQGQTM